MLNFHLRPFASRLHISIVRIWFVRRQPKKIAAFASGTWFASVSSGDAIEFRHAFCLFALKQRKSMINAWLLVSTDWEPIKSTLFVFRAIFFDLLCLPSQTSIFIVTLLRWFLSCHERNVREREKRVNKIESDSENGDDDDDDDVMKKCLARSNWISVIFH